MKIFTISGRDDDRSARQVALAAILALMFGGTFLIHTVEGAQQPVPAPAAATGTNPGTATVARAEAPAASGGAATARRPPDGSAPATSARSTATGNDNAPKRERGWSAASWAALLWALACCAVGALFGFIFGIPRTLSSDTARTALPVPAQVSEAAKARAASLKAAAGDRDKAIREAGEADAELARAAAELNQLRAAAGEGADTDTRVRAKAEAHARLLEKKAKLDQAVLEKTKAAAKAEEQVKKDEDTSRVAGPPKTTALARPLNARGPSTAVNTNLEQISDWLTKIIVGVSLINSERIGDSMVKVSKEMAKSFGGTPMESLALATLTYFGVVGLLGGYLLTRLYLQRAFEEIGSFDPPGQGQE